MKLEWTRRQFAFCAFASSAAGAAGAPLRIGHRQASMLRAGGPAVFELARRIPGLEGVELQVHLQNTTLWDRETLLAYRNAARQAGLEVPSLAGIWPKGTTLLPPGPAEQAIRKSVQAAAELGAKVLLAAAFKDNCPAMDRAESYGPVVELLQKTAGAAADAGVTLALETSNSPADDRKLIDLVARPSVKVYYDAHNVATYGHTGQAVPGYETLGRARIAQIHLKNRDKLLEEPGEVDWTAALAAIRRIGYTGWLFFETAHSGPEQCVEATRRNIEFVRRRLAG